MIDMRRIRQMGASFIRRYRCHALFRDVFESPDGKRVLVEILRMADILSTPMVAGAPDVTSYNMGRQSLALEIIEILRWNPERVIALAAERDRIDEERAREAA